MQEKEFLILTAAFDDHGELADRRKPVRNSQRLDDSIYMMSTTGKSIDTALGSGAASVRLWGKLGDGTAMGWNSLGAENAVKLIVLRYTVLNILETIELFQFVNYMVCELHQYPFKIFSRVVELFGSKSNQH